MKFTYHYRAHRTPFLTGGKYTERHWAVTLKDSNGGVPVRYGLYVSGTHARLVAWWRNRRRGFNTCGSTWYRRVSG